MDKETEYKSTFTKKISNLAQLEIILEKYFINPNYKGVAYTHTHISMKSISDILRGIGYNPFHKYVKSR